jgi:hypothetical protein
MRTAYKLLVEPIDGLTLHSDTKKEWSLGYLFRVLYSQSPLWRPNQTVSIAEVNDQEQWHPVKYDVEFKYLTVKEHVERRAETDYDYSAVAMDNDEDGYFQPLTRGQ